MGSPERRLSRISCIDRSGEYIHIILRTICRLTLFVRWCFLSAWYAWWRYSVAISGLGQVAAWLTRRYCWGGRLLFTKGRPIAFQARTEAVVFATLQRGGCQPCSPLLPAQQRLTGPKSPFVVLRVDLGGNGACAAQKCVGWPTHNNWPEVGNSC